MEFYENRPEPNENKYPDVLFISSLLPAQSLLMGFYFVNIIHSNMLLLCMLIFIIELINMNFSYKGALERCEELLEFMELQSRECQVQCQAPDIGPDTS